MVNVNTYITSLKAHLRTFVRRKTSTKMNLEMRFTLNFPISKTTFRPSFAFVMTRCLKINLNETSKRYNSFPTNILILTDLLLLFQLQQPCLRLTVCEKFSACPWQLDPWLVIPAPTHPWERKTIRNLKSKLIISSHSKCVTPFANGKRKSRVQWSTHRKTVAKIWRERHYSMFVNDKANQNTRICV